MATIVITGASRGIGFETARTLAKTGNRVIAIARSIKGLEALHGAAVEQAKNADIHILPFDIAHGDYNAELLPVVSDLGPVDVVINNAGFLINKPFEETSMSDFSALLEGNLLGHVRMIQHLLP